MTRDDQAFLALLSIGVFSVDQEGRIWRHRCLVGSRLGAPSYWATRASSRAETSHSGQRPNGTKYLRVMFNTVEDERMSTDAHRIVWMVANQRDIPPALEVNHKNGNGEDNRPENLELVTRSQNTSHAIHVLGKIARPKKMNGDKITPAQVLEIRDLCDRRAMTLAEIASRYDITVKSVQNIAGRKTWRHIPDGLGG
jgi:hypothetical protein